MNSPNPSRREFVASSASMLGGGWLAVHLPLLGALAACARDAAARHESFTTFTAEQARTMAACAAQVIPSDEELPGATEAGAVYFIDAALDRHFTGMRDPILAGLGDLDARAKSRGAGITSFAELDASGQVTVMREVEQTPFFFMARMLTVMGTIADPSYGGNRDHAGERILAMQHRPVWTPPLGWYDAEDARARRGAGGTG